MKFAEFLLKVSVENMCDQDYFNSDNQLFFYEIADLLTQKLGNI